MQTKVLDSAESSAEDGVWDIQFSSISVEKHKHFEQDRKGFGG